MRLVLMLLALVALAGLALAAGRSWLGPVEVMQALFSGPEGVGRMLWSLRLPRLITGLIAGMCLGAAGLVFQTLLRNPLASPDVIGLTQCAAFGAVAALMAGLPPMAGAWVGAVSAIILLGWLAAHPREGLAPRAVVLQGLGLALLAGAGTEALILRAGDGNASMAMAWLTGTLNGAGWPEVGRALWLVPLLAPVFAARRILDRLELGDDLARSLGLRVGVLRAALGLLAALVAAGAVSLCGPLGFVALAAGPVSRWLARRRPDPFLAALVGAGFVTLADVLARGLAPAALLPTGLYTALIGAPILLVVLRRQMSDKSS
ncbi:iron chelate uptake ABC transporter family permease subunit [Gemmobacter sp. LW-1]|uniref:FecCD family ABC transporter permease n=1 Tax=Gemmobacter sp. LW-1 TaxID=1529005 RepID=UPI0006C745FE|nr:iron ABC transporter permease [Gemmobacter sp. LW-1]